MATTGFGCYWARKFNPAPRRRGPGCSPRGRPSQPGGMVRVAVIGLGAMGKPIARRLAERNFEVVGLSRTSTWEASLTDSGVRAAASVEEAVRGARFVVTALPSSEVVRAVLLGPQGVFSSAPPGTVVIDFSTTSPAVSRQLAAEGEELGLHVLDAPVSGGVIGAATGTLAVMVGGTDAAFEAGRAIFEAVAGIAVHVGPAGHGQLVKAANQLIVAGVLGLVGEAVVLLEAYTVDTRKAVQVLGGGQLKGPLVERKAVKMLERDFSPQFRLELLAKDLDIVMETARAAGLTLPMTVKSGRLVELAKAGGAGDLDCSAVFQTVSDLARHAMPTEGA